MQITPEELHPLYRKATQTGCPVQGQNSTRDAEGAGCFIGRVDRLGQRLMIERILPLAVDVKVGVPRTPLTAKSIGVFFLTGRPGRAADWRVAL